MDGNDPNAPVADPSSVVRETLRPYSLIFKAKSVVSSC